MRKISVSFIAASALLFAASSVSLAQAGTKPKTTKPAGAPAAAPAAASAAAPMPAPEMAKVQWMAGTWQCTGKMLASSMGPEHPIEAQVVSEIALDGFWILHHYREKKTAQNTMPIAADEGWTYDGAGKAWQRLIIDNTGGWATGTAKGWEKGKLVWTSDGMMAGQKAKFRDTFIEKNPRELTYTGDIGSAEGKWTPVWELTCKK